MSRAVGVAAWVTVLVVSLAWGWTIAERLPYMSVPPFASSVRVLAAWRWLIPVAVGTGLILAVPVLCRRLSWVPLLFACWLGSTVWAVALAVTTGVRGLTDPLRAGAEYLHTLPLRDGAGVFVATFVERLPDYTTHTRGHPPGPVLVLHALHRFGLPVVPAEAVLVIGVGCSAVAAVAVTVRVVAGEEAARAALPFLVLAPLALWVASSMDALFMGVMAWGTALLARATALSAYWAYPVAFVGGLLLGSGLYLSYGMAAFGLLPLAVILARRRWWLLGPSALAVGAVAVVFTTAGFWWFTGLDATHHEWSTSVGARRSYWYFLLGNLGVLAFMVGPAVAAGVAALRDRRIWWLVGAALLVILGSDLAGFERGEVERIWLPFAIWLIPATAALPGRPHAWLAAQAVLAVGFQCLVMSAW